MTNKDVSTLPSGIEKALAALADGSLSAEGLVKACLARIEARESVIRAWEHVDADGALACAREADKARARGDARALLGIPVGIKDVIDVRGLPTGAGTPAYRTRVAERDAEAVSRLRAAGAIILGKTVTTAFAGRDPALTRNPCNVERSPGGSSSGSAAAVADGMCLAALGTQSGGSVLRPAAYCGVVGFKPGSGETPLAGVIPNVTELDHVGCLVTTVADAYRVFYVLADAGRASGPAALSVRRPRRVWRIRGVVDAVEPACEQAVDNLCAQLAETGVEVIERPLPPEFDNLPRSRDVVGAVVQACYFDTNPDVDESLLPPGVAQVLAYGRSLDAVTFNHALRHRVAFRRAMNAALEDVDAALLAVAPGMPPLLDNTGDAGLLSPWTLIGLPALSLPVGYDPTGMPTAVQLLSGNGRDLQLLGVAAWCERRRVGT